MKDKILIMPDSQIAIQIATEEPQEPVVYALPQKTKFIKTKELAKISEDFLKLVSDLPQSCLYSPCITELAKSFPELPMSCLSCLNSERLVLKLGFIPKTSSLCTDCPISGCTKKSPLFRARAVLFGSCLLLEK